ncbi:DUF6171 family protein [Salipaludibacillus sp. CF4.18]|uniref:DUF6171 family protein n=1 Tax=Salipaludibacillus sp. CF4.18 TaxID=3373081 RepID=UPI003EE72715
MLIANNATRVCKSCDRDVTADIEIDVSDEESVSEETYQKRLGICMECPSLQYGTTCQHSGSIVYHRAMLKDKKCPKPLDAQW